MARTSTTKMTARDRARATKAMLDAAERDHEKLVEDVVIAYYEADDAREAAVDAMAAAETARAVAVTTLSELHESVTRIATLTGLGVGEVRKLKRTAATPSKDTNRAHTLGGVDEAGYTPAGDPHTEQQPPPN